MLINTFSTNKLITNEFHKTADILKVGQVDTLYVMHTIATKVIPELSDNSLKSSSMTMLIPVVNLCSYCHECENKLLITKRFT